jgi:N-acetylglutamate synthase/N-acetylornithine aminotransferase
MRRASFTVSIDLAAGRAQATVTTSDLTPAYVRFNSAYST